MHTGTGLATVVVERGPGAAIINHANQMNDAQRSVMYLAAGGVLDRNPDARVAFIESGASWLVALAERRSEEHTSELQPLMRISYAVFCLKKKTKEQKANTQSNY